MEEYNETMLAESVTSMVTSKNVNVRDLYVLFDNIIKFPALQSNLYVSTPGIKIHWKENYTINENTGNKERLDNVEAITYTWTESHEDEPKKYTIKTKKIILGNL